MLPTYNISHTPTQHTRHTNAIIYLVHRFKTLLTLSLCIFQIIRSHCRIPTHHGTLPINFYTKPSGSGRRRGSPEHSLWCMAWLCKARLMKYSQWEWNGHGHQSQVTQRVCVQWSLIFDKVSVIYFSKNHESTQENFRAVYIEKRVITVMLRTAFITCVFRQRSL